MSGNIFGFNPIEMAPALIATVVGVLVWRRHRADRRARLFLALAASELAFGLPVILSLGLPETRFGVAALDGLLVTLALVSTALFLHFGLAFPHARPWLQRGRMSSLYLAAVLIGIVPIGAAVAGETSQAAMQDVFGGIMAIVGPLVLASGIAACVAIVRGYREMTVDERRTYRAPVMGVLVGMLASMVVSVILGVMFGLLFGMDDRYAVWTANTLATAGELVLPLFFFMAAFRYRLLERHSQDYVSLSDTAPRR